MSHISDSRVSLEAPQSVPVNTDNHLAALAALLLALHSPAPENAQVPR